jgi:hypothetical protein
MMLGWRMDEGEGDENDEKLVMCSEQRLNFAFDSACYVEDLAIRRGPLEVPRAQRTKSKGRRR